MKRFVLFSMALLILLALGIVVSPIVLGKLIKKNYSQLLTQISSKKGAQLTMLSYKNNWYTDQATVQVDLSGSGWKINGQDQITLKQTIDVGPILRQPNGGYMWQLARVNSKYQQGETSYQGTALIDLHKKIIIRNSINEVTLSNKGKTSELTDLNITLTHEPGKQDIQATLGSLVSRAGTDKKAVPLLSANGVHYHKTTSGAGANATQETAINIDKVSLGSDPKRKITASNALIQQKTQQHNKNMKIHYRLYAKQFRIGDLPTRTIDVDFAVNNLSQALLGNLTHDITTLTNPSSTDNQLEIMQDVIQVLNNGLAITFNRVFMSTPNGPLSLTGTVHLAGSTNLASMLNPLSNLQANLHGKVPMQWLVAEIKTHKKLASKQEARQQIASWLADGLLRQEGNEILFSLIYKKGNFYLSTPDNKTLTKFYWGKHPQVDASAN
jgi:hypothetical protein